MSTAYSQPMASVFRRAGAVSLDMVSRAGYCLLVLVAIVSPWGQLQRLAGDSGDMRRGVTTLLAIGVIFVSLATMRFFHAIFDRPRVLCFTVFVLLGTFASFLHGVAIEGALLGAMNRGGYWVLMVAVMSLGLGARRGRVIVLAYTVSTAVMCGLSLIDYCHLVNIPGFNEGYTEFRLNEKDPGSMVGRALIGPFATRTIIAPYLALAWAVPLMQLIHGKSKNPLRIAFWAGAFTVLTLAVILNYSRTIYITMACGVVYAAYTSGFRRLWRLALLVAPLAAVLIIVVPLFFPHEVTVFLHRLASLGPGSFVQTGGHFRIELFRTTIRELLQYPLGMGFGLIDLGQIQLMGHSIITEHLRPGGWLGFAMTTVFIWPVFKVLVRRRVDSDVAVLCAALIGALSFGLAHSTQNLLCMWVVLGMVYAITPSHKEAPSTPRLDRHSPLPARTGQGPSPERK